MNALISETNIVDAQVGFDMNDRGKFACKPPRILSIATRQVSHFPIHSELFIASWVSHKQKAEIEI